LEPDRALYEADAFLPDEADAFLPDIGSNCPVLSRSSVPGLLTRDPWAAPPCSRAGSRPAGRTETAPPGWEDAYPRSKKGAGPSLAHETEERETKTESKTRDPKPTSSPYAAATPVRRKAAQESKRPWGSAQLLDKARFGEGN